MATTRYHQTNWTSTERTPIDIIASERTAVCHKCHIEVTPNKIITAHLNKPMHVCPKCKSVIQENNYVTNNSNHDR